MLGGTFHRCKVVAGGTIFHYVALEECLHHGKEADGGQLMVAGGQTFRQLVATDQFAQTGEQGFVEKVAEAVIQAYLVSVVPVLVKPGEGVGEEGDVEFPIVLPTVWFGFLQLVAEAFCQFVCGQIVAKQQLTVNIGLVFRDGTEKGTHVALVVEHQDGKTRKVFLALCDGLKHTSCV